MDLVVKLKFFHVDTGVVLEVRLLIDEIHGDTTEYNIDFGVAESNGENDSSRFLLDGKGDEEEEMPNEYGDDEFVVGNSTKRVIKELTLTIMIANYVIMQAIF